MEFYRKSAVARCATAVLAFMLLASACGGGDERSTAESINPADANSVTRALVVKVGDNGGTLVTGSLPVGSGVAGEPAAVAGAFSPQGAAGSTTGVALQVETSGAALLTRVFAKIPGADEYLEVRLSPGSGKSDAIVKAQTILVVGISLPSNLLDGTFCLDFTAEDDQQRVSNAVRACVEVGDPPRGLLQGTYVLPDGLVYITFFGTFGTYLVGANYPFGSPAESGVGLEAGTFAWNPDTEIVFLGAPFIDQLTNCDGNIAQCGLYPRGDQTTLTRRADGSLSGEAVLEAAPVDSVPGTLVGSFQVAGDSGALVVVAFIDDGAGTGEYFLVSTEDAPATEVFAGIEHGCYSTTTSGGTITFVADTSTNCTVAGGTPAVDTTGASGFTSPSSSGQTFTFQFEGSDRIRGVDNEGFEFTLMRIPVQ